MVFGFAGLDSFVKVEDFLERRCEPGLADTLNVSLAYCIPIWRSRNELPLEAIVATWCRATERRGGGVLNSDHGCSKAGEEAVEKEKTR